MSPVLVHVDALDFFRIHVSANVVSFVDDQAFLALLIRFIGEDRSEQTRANH
ncbi:hypothetical protein D3C77_465100 [compost metagenome]